ncbi:MAG: hypothetical protein AAGK23_01825 [Pseudomonadota bacterium]
MAREIDDKKKRKALRKLRKAAERAEAEGGPGLSDWEREFVEEVEARVEKFGSAFADPDKGNLDEPLSALQARKLKEIDKKSRGKDGGFKKRGSFSKSAKAATYKPRVRDIHDDLEEDTQAPAKSARPTLVQIDSAPPSDAKTSAPKPPAQRPVLRLVKGGKPE